MINSEKKVNSEEYWNDRFLSGSWDENLGKDQTRYFYSLLISMLPERIQMKLRQSHYSITDFGCAEGQGVPILAGALGGNVKGVDFSGEAIARAKELFPQYAFEVADVWQYQTVSDVSVLSNIIEHFPNPYELLERISTVTRKYMIVMIPLEETDLMTEHCYTFLYENLPMTVNDFRLIYFSEHDCRKDPEQLFLARQVLLVYSREEEDFNSATIACLDGQILARRSQTEEKEQMIQNRLDAIAQDCAADNANEESHFALIQDKLDQIAQDCAAGNANEEDHFALIQDKLDQIAQDCAAGNANEENHFALVENKLAQIVRDCEVISTNEAHHFARIENKLDQISRISTEADEQQIFP